MTIETDTIFALSSGAGRAGVAVFRLSGQKTEQVVKTLAGHRRLTPRKLALRTLKSEDKTHLDVGLVALFPGPKSFTGETCAEVFTHGSPAVIAAMSEAFIAAGARQAEPGEFTRRAFDNGKMDLTAAEGLADLIDAETEGQRRQAFRQMQGGLREVYQQWRVGLIEALAAIEGEIDFPDEQDVPDNQSHAAYPPLAFVMTDMQKALDQAGRSERIRAGIRAAIIGPPNAGKSTLLNRLAGRDAAIVSDEAGTTRDVIDVHMTMAGLPVSFSDTAGLRETDNKIEAEGVRRALLSSEDADLRIGVISPDTESGFAGTKDALRSGDFLVVNKTDLGKVSAGKDGVRSFNLSAQSGDGFESFMDALELEISRRFDQTEQAGLTRARHRACTQRALEALARAQEKLATAPELAGDDVRSALHAIKELAGEADIEAVLGAIFSRFCIGK